MSIKSIFEQKNFAQKIYCASKESELHPLFITAQAALESGWGAKAIGNNIFGITKGRNWKGKTQLVITTEYFTIPNKSFVYPECVIKVTPIETRQKVIYKYTVKRLFREYDSLTECINDHMQILKKDVYRDAWPYRKDPYEFTKRIVDEVGGKYATAPNYVSVMSSIIKKIEIWAQQEKW